MSYKSPIEIITEEMRIEQVKQLEDNIYKAIQKCNINIDKDELIKALNYDRQQYEKGFSDGVAYMRAVYDMKFNIN